MSMFTFSSKQWESGVCRFCAKDISRMSPVRHWETDSGMNCDSSPDRGHHPADKDQGES